MKPHHALRDDASDGVIATLIPVFVTVVAVALLTVALVVACLPFALAFHALKWAVAP